MTKKGEGIRKRGDCWYLDFRHDGTRHYVRLGRLISKTAAKDIAKVKRGEILKGESGMGAKKRKDLTFQEAQELFLSWARTNTRPRTAVFYEQCLAKLSEEFGAKKLSQIAPFHLEAYKSRRKEEAPVRLNRELATLKAMYNRLGMGKKGLKKYDGANPVVDVEALEESEGRLRVLSRDEEARLLASARDPLRTLLLVGLYGGLRVKSEGLTLTWGSIDLGRRSLTVAAAYAKANRTRNVPMNSALVEAFRNLKERTVKTGPDDPVFVSRNGERLRSFRTAFTTARKAAGLSADVTPHVLRHTFASRLVEEGADLVTVQQLGGWAELAMVQRYAHPSPEHRRSAVEKLMPAADRGMNETSSTPQLRKVETA